MAEVEIHLGYLSYKYIRKCFCVGSEQGKNQCFSNCSYPFDKIVCFTSSCWNLAFANWGLIQISAF